MLRGMGASGSERRAGAGIRSINAVTLTTTDMARAVAFYGALGFRASYGGASAAFTSLTVGTDEHLNLALPDAVARGSGTQGPRQSAAGFAGWGRIVFYLDEIDAVDALYERALDSGLGPQAPPRDAEWGERYFHLRDPDGHELSFAAPLSAPAPHGGGASR